MGLLEQLFDDGVELSRCSKGVTARTQCQRCLRVHSAVRYTVFDARNAAVSARDKCPCYEEKPEPRLFSFITSFFGRQRDPLRNVSYNDEKHCYFVECSRCQNRLSIQSFDKSSEAKRKAVIKITLSCWKIEPLVVCERCRKHESIEPKREEELNT